MFHYNQILHTWLRLERRCPQRQWPRRERRSAHRGRRQGLRSKQLARNMRSCKNRLIYTWTQARKHFLGRSVNHSIWNLHTLRILCIPSPAKNFKAKLMFSLCSVGWDHQSGANRAAGPKSWLGWTHIITWSWTMCFAKDNFAWLLCGRQDKILRPLKVIYCLSMISNAKQPQKMISPKWLVVVNLASPKFRLAGTKPNVQVDTGF